jgi:hypothetical protein
MGFLDVAIRKAIEELRTRNFEYAPLTFYCGGTGVRDEDAIEYWKGSGVIVVARDGTKYLNGELYLEDDLK